MLPPRSLRLTAALIALAWHAAALADLPAQIEAVKPAIVVVGYYKATNNPRFAMSGTGFAVGDGNQLITNAHVLADPATADLAASLMVQVRTGAGPGVAALEARAAVVVEVDRAHDLALLRIEGKPLPALKLNDGSRVREGQSVALMGFPVGGVLGFAPVTHRGIIASITPVAIPSPTSQQLNAKNVVRLRDGSFDVFQLDATAYPGNSGGPLFDADTGEVVGVINMVFVKGTRESALSNPTGITYAIPATHVLQLLQRQGPAPKAN